MSERELLGEKYSFLGTIFDIDKAITILKDKPVDDISAEQVQKLAPQLISNLSDEHIILGTPVNDKDWALKNADLNRPVIWFSSPNFSMLIDGYHRMYRAYKENKGLKVQVIDNKQDAKLVVIDWRTKTNPITRWFKKDEIQS